MPAPLFSGSLIKPLGCLLTASKKRSGKSLAFLHPRSPPEDAFDAIEFCLANDKKVGVIAVDPTSPFTGGALLGDRVRLN